MDVLIFDLLVMRLSIFIFCTSSVGLAFAATPDLAVPLYTTMIANVDSFVTDVTEKLQACTTAGDTGESVNAITSIQVPAIRFISFDIANRILHAVNGNSNKDKTDYSELRKCRARSFLESLTLETLKFSWLIRRKSQTPGEYNWNIERCNEPEDWKADTQNANFLARLIGSMYAIASGCNPNNRFKLPNEEKIKKTTIAEFPNGEYVSKADNGDANVEGNNLDSNSLVKPGSHGTEMVSEDMKPLVAHAENTVDAGADTKLVVADEQAPRAPSHFDATTGAQTIVILEANLVDQMATVATLMSSLGRTSIGGAANVQILNTYIDLVQRAMIQIESIDTQLAQVITAQGLVFTQIKEITKPVA